MNVPILEIPPQTQPPLDAIDMLDDGQWRWVPAIPQEGIKAGAKANYLWIHGTPTEHGRYPVAPPKQDPRYEQAYRADFFTEQDSTTPYLGWDIYANLGRVVMNRRVLPAIIVRWPSPDFLDKDNADSNLFIRRFMPGERINPFTF